MSASPAASAARQSRSVSSAQASEVKVSIDNFNFTPKDLTRRAGTQVTWVNHDDVPHTVTSDDKKFASNALDTDDEFSASRSPTPASYPYYCKIHPRMTGSVTVKAA